MREVTSNVATGRREREREEKVVSLAKEFSYVITNPCCFSLCLMVQHYPDSSEWIQVTIYPLDVTCHGTHTNSPVFLFLLSHSLLPVFFFVLANNRANNHDELSDRHLMSSPCSRLHKFKNLRR